MTPNVAILLDEPLDVTPYTRRTFLSGGVRKRIGATRTTAGFLVAVRRPEALRSALEPTGLQRKLNSSDQDLLEPHEEDAGRLRRAERLGAFGLAWLGLVIAEQVWRLFSGS